MSSPTTAKLTIGIPTKNRASMLAKLLDDIEKYQPDLPVVVSDNSDQVDTANVVNQYVKRLNIKYVHIKNNISQAENFNSVLKNSMTKYVIIMHDDDRLMPISINTYLSLIDYIEKNCSNLFAIYVTAFKFKNDEELNYLLKTTPSKLSLIDLNKNIKIFKKDEFREYFVQEGEGGRAPGVLVNRHLLEVNDVYFPTDTGSKHDKAFFLTANALGSVGEWKKGTIARQIHESNSINRNITKNFYLFNQKILEIYSGDDLSIKAIHKKRIERWMEFEPRFKPLDCFFLILSSKVDFFEGLNLLAKYLYRYSKKFARLIKTLFKTNWRVEKL